MVNTFTTYIKYIRIIFKYTTIIFIKQCAHSIQGIMHRWSQDKYSFRFRLYKGEDKKMRVCEKGKS